MPDIVPSTFRLIGSQAEDGAGKRLPDSSVSVSAIIVKGLMHAGLIDAQAGEPGDAGLDLLKLLLDTSGHPALLKGWDEVSADWVGVGTGTPQSFGLYSGFTADKGSYAALKGMPARQLQGLPVVRVRGARGGVFEIVEDTAPNVTAALAADPGEGVNVALTYGGGTKYARRSFIGPAWGEWWGMSAASADNAAAFLAAATWCNHQSSTTV